MPSTPPALAQLRDFLALLGRRFGETRCPQVAGSLAFTTLLSLVPLVTVAIVMFGRFSGLDALGDALQSFLLTNLLPDKAGKIIATYALQFSEKAANLTLLGAAMLVASALMLLVTIEGVFNNIWGVRGKRSLWTRVTMYWMALTIGQVVFGVCVLATTEFLKLSLGVAPKVVWLREMGLQLTSFVLLGGIFSLIYFVLPNRPVQPKHAITGGVLAGALFLAMQQVFGHYVARLPTYTLVYGTFAALPIFLAWLYLSWVVVLLGALVTATLPQFAHHRRGGTPCPGRPVLDALHMLQSLHEAHRRGHALPAALLHRVACCEAGDGDSLLQKMRTLRWVTCDDSGLWLPARPVEKLLLRELVQALALSPTDIGKGDERPLARVLQQELAGPLEAMDMPLSRLFAATDHSE